MKQQVMHRILVVGIGAQGAQIVDMLCDLGHDIVAAVDVGAKVGQPLSALTSAASVPDVVVRGSVSEALGGLVELPEIAVIAASLPMEQLVETAGSLLDHGVNVVTLHPDVFGRDDSWAVGLHARAVKGGASFLATGVQDTWWVQLPTLVASSSVSIDSVRIVSTLSLAQLSGSVGEMLGVGLTPEEFPKQVEQILKWPSVLGDPLREAARRMGATAGELHRDVRAVITEEPYEWAAGGTTVPVGHVVGTREVATFDTDRGIRFEGVLEVLPITQPETADELHISGVPEHHLRYQPFHGFEVTNVALVARVPDVVAAAPGVLFSADMPAATHQYRRDRG